VPISLQVNGEPHLLDVPPTRRLLAVLREDLSLTGAKHGCGEGACGACAVLLDGRPIASCLLPVGAAEGRAVTTVEGLSDVGASLQEAFVAEDAEADPRRDPRDARRESLPLRDVPEDRAGDSPRLGTGGRVTSRTRTLQPTRVPRASLAVHGRRAQYWTTGPGEGRA
jgi:hypothetical protein